MNHITLFLAVLAFTVSSCIGMLVLAGKFLQCDETQNPIGSGPLVGRMVGRGVHLHLPPPADQWRRNLVQRSAPRARRAHNGRQKIISPANRLLLPYLS